MERLRRWAGGGPAAPLPEPLVMGKNAVMCVCSEEWCFCTQLVPAPLEALAGLAELGVGVRMGDNPCPECRAGKHVWTPA